MTRRVARDWTGQKFGLLTAIRRVENDRNKNQRWLFRCDCGREKELLLMPVTHGGRTSCGCDIVHPTTHGLSKTPEYRTWAGMMQRCYDERVRSYRLYGGRGIVVCERWKSPENFVADMGPKPTAQHSIDRIDVNGNYEPSNCRWATSKQQCRNKRNNLLLTSGGLTLSLSEWAERTGLSRQMIFHRKRVGWSDSDAVGLPARHPGWRQKKSYQSLT